MGCVRIHTGCTSDSSSGLLGRPWAPSPPSWSGSPPGWWSSWSSWSCSCSGCSSTRSRCCRPLAPLATTAQWNKSPAPQTWVKSEERREFWGPADVPNDGENDDGDDVDGAGQLPQPVVRVDHWDVPLHLLRVLPFFRFLAKFQNLSQCSSTNGPLDVDVTSASLYLGWIVNVKT